MNNDVEELKEMINNTRADLKNQLKKLDELENEVLKNEKSRTTKH